ncbi:hypothetical protein SAMD00019534_109420 [Acytostelium subglobosum LB1]|uniref:hypothetical protein n=1 Tax=Acytostelium subglobosum LB1 TaxID=1410327 RepID=UPI000644EB42|nr:hypothetical protein SAMD00019534_109420 [Acytostelium subglobosum LB1]GAM27766.1 hypothetical protein SAMD00019534_109420 [Acytostelium subglobosum LB1]|eukprot:XP_012749425.1 hypothetical protein SAMD00019534_109420 [Acytostelium subglobosum LB1]
MAQNPNLSKNAMRGLTNFIADIRNATSKENEEKRVTKEMAHIRKEFKENKNIDGYQRRKYVCKLIYMYMLGYEIDFGYMEAVTLLSSTKFSEKQIGYIALGVLLSETHELLPLVINSFKEDLMARSDYFQSLALSAICNIGGKETAEFLAPVIQKLLIAETSSPMVKKRASLAILRMNRNHIGLVTPDAWVERLISVLNETDFGVLNSLMSLLIHLVSEKAEGWEPAVPKVVHLLHKIVIQKETAKEYIYYHIACPWLQVKLLRFLRYFPPLDNDANARKLTEVLNSVLSVSESAKAGTINHKNALNAVLFEAINLIIHYDNDPALLAQISTLLGRFITAKETNIRYLGLEAMSHFASLSNETSVMIKKYQDTVILSLRDADISIRRRALDLLYGMCDKDTSKIIVAELLTYLQTADYNIREELVIKIANLAEKFASNYSWYVDVILQLITSAGDFVSDDIWYRVVKIVTNHEDIQTYAASTVFNALQAKNSHETLVKVGGYILGEFGHLIADNPASTPFIQFNTLHSKFATCGLQTKALLLSTYAKFVNLFPELTQQTQEVFKQHTNYIDAEIQQRACEYLNLTNLNEDLMQTVLDVIPAFSENRDLINSNTGSIGAHGSNGMQQPQQHHQAIPATALSNGGGNSNVASGNQLDLLDPFGLGVGNQPQQQMPPQQPQLQLMQQPALPQLEQPAGGSPFGSGQHNLLSPTMANLSPNTGSTGSPIDPLQIKIANAFNRLCLNAEGVLYEDSMIQIGLKSEYNGAQGRIVLYYGNNSSFPLSGFNTVIESASTSALQVQAQSIAPVIQPKVQIQQTITFTCTGEFSESPTAVINFLTPGRPITIHLRLPIVVSKFFEPYNLNSGDFFAKWKILPGKPVEIQEVFKPSKPIDTAAFNKTLSEGLKITTLKMIDPNPNNLVSAALFPYGKSPLFVLIRIECNPQACMCRLTIRSQSAVMSNATKQLIVTHLS